MPLNNNKKEKSFEYLGKIFEPVITEKKYTWEEKVYSLWGGSTKESKDLHRLKDINADFNHTEFYKIAKINGCGKIDVFILDGEKVIPSNILRYFGEPLWHRSEKSH